MSVYAVQFSYQNKSLLLLLGIHQLFGLGVSVGVEMVVVGKWF